MKYFFGILSLIIFIYWVTWTICTLLHWPNSKDSTKIDIHSELKIFKNDSLIVEYDSYYNSDVATLCIGRKSKDHKDQVEIFRIFGGQEAKNMYKQLTGEDG